MADPPGSKEPQLSWLPTYDPMSVGLGYMPEEDIRTAHELTQRSDRWIQKQMSIVGLKMVKELRSIPCVKLEIAFQRKQSICTSRTFGEEVHQLDQLAQAISTYAAMCGSKLRKQDSCAGIITIFILTNPFKHQYSVNYKGIKKIIK